MQISFIRVHPDAVLPARATEKSFGYDLYLPESVTVKGRSSAILPTGWKLAEDLPLIEHLHLRQTESGTLQRQYGGGVAMLILPRSSTLRRYGLIVGNSPGLIDADYTGEIGVLVHNLSDTDVVIPRVTRIAQAVFTFLDFPTLAEKVHGTEEQTDTREARGGFGSTGV